MRLWTSLSLTVSFAAWTTATATQNAYSEHLDLTPLADHHIHADFQFKATTALSAYESHHYQYFPRSLAQLLHATSTKELHLRFALGRWDDEQWGPRPNAGRREGGTGVEIWAWIEGDNQTHIEERWSALVNSLSGLFCASLNFIDGTKTTQPVLTFEPEGTLLSSKTKLMHGLLPREVICTENLTPFLKLLPCKGKAGISSLLDGHKLFDSSWQSMSIDVRTICTGNDCQLEIEQDVSMALSIARSMKDRHDPIPKPLPIEDVHCDERKPWNSHDSCFPKSIDGEMAWTLSKVFGRTLRGKCGLSAQDDWPVTLHTSLGRSVDVIGASDIKVDKHSRQYALKSGESFDLNATQQVLSEEKVKLLPALFVSRQLTGQGQERGGMKTVIRNPHSYEQHAVFFESLPWFLRPYMHTLSVLNGAIEKMYYTPLMDRQRGTHLELLLSVPAESSVVLEYDIEKAILRYTDYPPDANRGFDIGAAIIRVLPSTEVPHDQYLRTTSLLLPLGTPDFSMPYNVIILTSTVIALGFGSIFNLLVRRFVLLDEVPESPLKQKLQKISQQIRQRLHKAAPDTKISVREKIDKKNGMQKTHIKDGTDVRHRKISEIASI